MIDLQDKEEEEEAEVFIFEEEGTHKEERILLGPFLYGVGGVVFKEGRKRRRKKLLLKRREEKGEEKILPDAERRKESEKDVEDVRDEEEERGGEQQLEGASTGVEVGPAPSLVHEGSGAGKQRAREEGHKGNGVGKRTFDQITRATGFVDTCDIVEVWRGSREEGGGKDKEKQKEEETKVREMEDLGGEEGMARMSSVEERDLLKRRRSFGMTMKSGVTVMFEVRFFFSFIAHRFLDRRTHLHPPPIDSTVLVHLSRNLVDHAPRISPNVLDPSDPNGRHRRNDSLLSPPRPKQQ